MPEQPIVCMFTTLQDMTHTIRTAYGDSDTTWGGQDIWAFPFDHPPQGLGQGNGAAPTGWEVVSAPIINMVRTTGYCATFVSALSYCSIISFVCYAFVEDTDLVHAQPGDNHIGSDLI